MIHRQQLRDIKKNDNKKQKEYFFRMYFFHMSKKNPIVACVVLLFAKKQRATGVLLALFAAWLPEWRAASHRILVSP